MNVEKPWVARMWAGPKLLVESRYAEAGKAQDALTEHVRQGTSFTKVAIDYEPEPVAVRRGCPDLDPNWPDHGGVPRGPTLCVLYPKCKCGTADKSPLLLVDAHGSHCTGEEKNEQV